MSLLLPTAIIILLLIIFVILTLRSQRRLQNALSISESACQEAVAEAHKQQRRRLVFERALALPMTSRKECDDMLWARALQGDQLAELILQEEMFDFSSGDQLPFMALPLEQS